jgi:Pentapeptide repeats (8 copies)
LFRTRFDGTSLNEAHLEGTNLMSAHLENALLNLAHLDGANLRGAFFSSGTDVEGVSISNDRDGSVVLADVRWGEVNLGAIPWRTMSRLGDERVARLGAPGITAPKSRHARLGARMLAVRAYRQLAAALRIQGLNEDADRYAYRAQTVQRHVLLREGKAGQWAFSLLLWTLAGYGYRLRRIFVAYILTLVVFAGIYYSLGLPNTASASSPVALGDAFLVSLTAIHGRVFLEQLGQYSVQAWVAAVESVVGIVIEGVFVAMLVQRFFGGR